MSVRPTAPPLAGHNVSGGFAQQRPQQHQHCVRRRAHIGRQGAEELESLAPTTGLNRFGWGERWKSPVPTEGSLALIATEGFAPVVGSNGWHGVLQAVSAGRLFIPRVIGMNTALVALSERADKHSELQNGRSNSRQLA